MPAAQESPRIGAQLRVARQAARMSMAEVAAQSGLTKGFLSKLERDLTNVSVASLIRLCDTLGISVGSLFQAAKGEVVRRGEYPAINFGGKGIREYLLTPNGEKRVQAILSEIEPGGGSGDEPYSLPTDVEFAFVLDGQLRVVVAGDELTLNAGDAFTFQSSAEHTFRVPPTAGPATVLWVFSPALPDHGFDVRLLAREQARASRRRVRAGAAR
jgi:transcriptional regulator with XRE-family HTH domain